MRELDTSTSLHATPHSTTPSHVAPLKVLEPLEQERACPACHQALTHVVRVTHCPCDAPWCAMKTETEHFVCVGCRAAE